MLPVCRTPDDVYAIPPFEVTCEDVEGFLDELREFHTLFRDCFVRREPREHFFRLRSPHQPLSATEDGDQNPLVSYLSDGWTLWPRK